MKDRGGREMEARRRGGREEGGGRGGRKKEGRRGRREGRGGKGTVRAVGTLRQEDALGWARGVDGYQGSWCRRTQCLRLPRAQQARGCRECCSPHPFHPLSISPRTAMSTCDRHSAGLVRVTQLSNGGRTKMSSPEASIGRG